MRLDIREKLKLSKRNFIVVVKCFNGECRKLTQAQKLDFKQLHAIWKVIDMNSQYSILWDIKDYHTELNGHNEHMSTEFKDAWHNYVKSTMVL